MTDIMKLKFFAHLMQQSLIRNVLRREPSSLRWYKTHLS